MVDIHQLEFEADRVKGNRSCRVRQECPQDLTRAASLSPHAPGPQAGGQNDPLTALCQEQCCNGRARSPSTAPAISLHQPPPAPPELRPPRMVTTRTQGPCWRCWLRPWPRAHGRHEWRPRSTVACAGIHRWSGVLFMSSGSTTW